MTKELKKLMTQVAKGKLTMEEANKLYKKPNKVAVRGSKGQTDKGKKNTHKRKNQLNQGVKNEKQTRSYRNA